MALAVADPRDDAPLGFAEEEALLTRAVDKRRREFRQGRACARAALVALGGPAAVIPQGPSREPRWPAGFVGSISHTHGLCGAAAARAEDFRAVGLDLEPAEAIEPGLWPRIATHTEALAFQAAALEHGLDGGTAMRLLFSAKECFYKCQHELTRTFMGFHDATVRLDGPRFVVRFEKAVGCFAAGVTLPGQWRMAEGFLMTTMTLPCGAGAA